LVTPPNELVRGDSKYTCIRVCFMQGGTRNRIGPCTYKAWIVGLFVRAVA
jgi:hypothetical protein